jgi:hypothetical protein
MMVMAKHTAFCICTTCTRMGGRMQMKARSKDKGVTTRSPAGEHNRILQRNKTQTGWASGRCSSHPMGWDWCVCVWWCGGGVGRVSKRTHVCTYGILSLHSRPRPHLPPLAVVGAGSIQRTLRAPLAPRLALVAAVVRHLPRLGAGGV